MWGFVKSGIDVLEGKVEGCLLCCLNSVCCVLFSMVIFNIVLFFYVCNCIFFVCVWGDNKKFIMILVFLKCVVLNGILIKCILVRLLLFMV